MIATATPGSLASLASRLTDPHDRETYAALISYFESLPPDDELFRLARLLGFLSLLGQRVPGALAELLTELREHTKATAEYRALVDDRLAAFPQEIAAGVDIGAIAKGMAEAFRRQLAITGLENTSNLLRNASREITALTSQISGSLRPITQDYKSIAGTISAGLEKLIATSDRLQDHNSHLIQQQRKSTWLWQAMLALVLFLAGALCGIYAEKRQTIDDRSNLGTQIQHSQTADESFKTCTVQRKLHSRKDDMQ